MPDSLKDAERGSLRARFRSVSYESAQKNKTEMRFKSAYMGHLA